jgi:hypothetical protein
MIVRNKKGDFHAVFINPNEENMRRLLQPFALLPSRHSFPFPVDFKLVKRLLNWHRLAQIGNLNHIWNMFVDPTE